MHTILIKAFKIYKFIRFWVNLSFSGVYCNILFYLNGIDIKSFSSNGIPHLHKSLNAKVSIGKNFQMNNGIKYSDSGTNGKCRIDIRDNAILIIGDNVGISDVTITCHQKITIGNNVLIGVGTQIRDTDNHSLNPDYRKDPNLDWENKKTAPILIKNSAYIGAYSFILKGVTIGENAIIGAGSIVTKNIPDNEIWAGNPAKFVRNIQEKI